MGNGRLSGKQVGSQASRRVVRRLAWIQPVCISIIEVPAQKWLRMISLSNSNFSHGIKDMGAYKFNQLHV